MKLFTLIILLVCDGIYISSNSALLLPYGESIGDTSLGDGDNEAVLFHLQNKIKLWDKEFEELYISFNGAILTTNYTNVSPDLTWNALPGYSIMVYFADSVVSEDLFSSNILVRESTSQRDLDTAKHLVGKKDIDFHSGNISSVLVVTWINVKDFRTNNIQPKLASFQAVLVNNGSTTYVILSYEKLDFDAKAKTGFVISPSKFCDLEGSMNSANQLKCRSNVYRPGLFVVGLTKNAKFQCNSENILPFDCSHCQGEETWTHACNHSNQFTTPICSTHGTKHSNHCQFHKDMCKTNGTIEETPCLCEDNQNPCIHGNCSLDANEGYKCVCEAGYTGRNCSTKFQIKSSSSPLTSISTTAILSSNQSRKITPSLLQDSATRITPSHFQSAIEITPSQLIRTAPMSSLKIANSQPIVKAVQCTFEDFPEEQTCKVETTNSWYYNTGSTFTSGTGPSVDATTETSEGGYVYLEATELDAGAKESLYFNITNTIGTDIGCVLFAYHMYGSGIGTLSLKLEQQHIWSKSGNHGDKWFRADARLNLDPSKSHFMISFEGFRYLSTRSDMALDDIVVYLGTTCETFSGENKPGTESTPSLTKTIMTSSVISVRPSTRIITSPASSTNSPTATVATTLGVVTPNPTSSTPTADTLLYPYGVENGDRIVPASDDNVERFSLSKPMKLFTAEKKEFYISINGYLSTNPLSPNHTEVVPGMPQNSTEAYIVLLAADLRTDQGAGQIYWRESFEDHILIRASMDIKKRYNDVMFAPNHVLVVSYIGVPAFESNTITNTFQVVLASDGHKTYGIFNYQKTDSSGSFEISETSCNYLKIADASNSSTLSKSSNVGKTGRHVYKLTNNECFPIIPVQFFAEEITLNKGYGSFNISILRENQQSSRFVNEESLPVEHVFIQPVFENKREIRNATNNMMMIVYKNDFQVDYLASSSFSEDVKITSNVMVLYKGTTRDSIQQYGSIVFNHLGADTKCINIKFNTVMGAIPSIVLSVHDTTSTQDGANLNFVFNWCRNVTTYGAEICARAVNSFVEIENVTLNFVALASHIDNNDTVTMPGKVTMAASKDDSEVCEYISFQSDFMDIPQVFLYVEVLDDSANKGNSNNDAYFTWIQALKKTGMRLCRRNVQGTNFSVHYIIHGQLNSCGLKQCPTHRECSLVKDGDTTKAQCRCIKHCPEASEEEAFCGTDGVTYKSVCHMEQEFCRRFNRTSHVTIQYKGQCQNIPYQSGKMKLENLPGVPSAFCKYISFHQGRFKAASNISVQLTVSWQQQQQQVHKSHHATAAWSESVSTRGFKACVFVTGRYFFVERIKEAPTIHWVAYQSVFTKESHGALESGVVDLPEWYTGGKCGTVSLNGVVSSQSNILISVEHLRKRALKNAMTVWAERILRKSPGTLSGSEEVRFKICARELQNFDGVHEGIRLHWLAIHKNFPPYISQNKKVIFPSQLLGKKEGDMHNCKKLLYNYDFPILRHPNVILGQTVNTTSQISDVFKTTMEAFRDRQPTSQMTFSSNDITTWIEQSKDIELTLCYKALSNPSTITSPAVEVSYVVFPELCEDGFIYNAERCYKLTEKASNFSEAEQECKRMHGSLISIEDSLENRFVQNLLANQNANIWIGMNRRNGSSQWTWADGSRYTYRRWKGNKSLDTNYNRECAVFNSNQTWWDDVQCDQEKYFGLCKKDADFNGRACEANICLNGGTCLKKGDKLTTECKCMDGYYGDRCESKAPPYEGCRNYTLHNEPWRMYDNKAQNIKSIIQPHTTSCDATRLNTGWHRFIGRGGSILSTHCPGSRNHCGTERPGWINGTHPTVVGEIRKTVLQYYSFYCADDSAEVQIQNCGEYFVYKFTDIPFWSCEFGLCTSIM